VVVATLETQKGKFLQRLGPRLLIVDEYQMIADPVRGVNYELALALAPPETQLLLLSGSVANPHESSPGCAASVATPCWSRIRRDPSAGGGRFEALPNKVRRMCVALGRG